MKLIFTTDLDIKDIKVYRYSHLSDHCDYFSESYILANVFRGLHFQINPNMAKNDTCD